MTRRLLGVRLGRFHMYSPRPMRLPSAGLADGTAPLRIALVTAVRNQAQYVARTIRSVLDQPYANLDYVVKDAASTDDTASFARAFDDPRLRVVSKVDAGLADGLNQGFALAQGEVMAWLNGDDLLLPGALQYVAQYLARHPDVDVVYGHRIVIDEMDREIGRWVLPPHSDAVLSWDDYLPQETVFWRRALWERAGGRVDPAFDFAVDWDLWLRFREHGARFVRLPRFLGAFRAHAQQKTAVQMGDVGRREIDALRTRSLGRTPHPLLRGLATAPYLARHVALSGLDRLFGLYD